MKLLENKVCSRCGKKIEGEGIKYFSVRWIKRHIINPHDILHLVNGINAYYHKECYEEHMKEAKQINYGEGV